MCIYMYVCVCIWGGGGGGYITRSLLFRYQMPIILKYSVNKLKSLNNQTTAKHDI